MIFKLFCKQLLTASIRVERLIVGIMTMPSTGESTLDSKLCTKAAGGNIGNWKVSGMAGTKKGFGRWLAGLST
jgi:hypothetical protein